MPLILKINIVITTQRACPILEYYTHHESNWIKDHWIIARVVIKSGKTLQSWLTEEFLMPLKFIAKVN